MTREEAIKILEPGVRFPDFHHTADDVDEACKMAVAALRTQEDPPPNDPLTLEGLREMGEEPTPVYCENYGWIICHGVSSFCGYQQINLGDGIFIEAEGYG